MEIRLTPMDETPTHLRQPRPYHFSFRSARWRNYTRGTPWSMLLQIYKSFVLYDTDLPRGLAAYRNATKRQFLSLLSPLQIGMESLHGLLHRFAAKLCQFWGTYTQKWSMTARLTFLLSVIVGAFGLRFAYQAMVLATWTARKDFVESCREVQVSATEIPWLTRADD